MQSGQTLTSDELPITSRWSLGKEPSISSDSGYGSAGMQEGGIEACQPITEGVALPSHRIFAIERKITRLKLFDREIPQSIRYRFSDLHDLFQMPLYEYLTKARVKPSGHAMKLKVLGESAETAKPWILVLCAEMASKRIKKFFNQGQIKAEYQPSNPDMPSFQVYVCNRAPRAMAARVDVYADWQDHMPLCGQMIEVSELDGTRIATLGGVIKVLSSDANSKLYGMTAGHIIAQEPMFEDNDFECDEEAVSDEDEQSLPDEDRFELDLGFDEDQGPRDVDTEFSDPTDWQSVQHRDSWPLIGHVHVTSDPTSGPDLDWALIDFDKTALQSQSNTFTFPGSDTQVSRELRALACEPTVDDPDRDVVLVSGSGRIKPGKIATAASYLNMGLSKECTETYTLTLRHGSMLDPGDCGSWVVDRETCEIYGHVVAVDALEEAYIIPLNATLRDIQKSLAAKSVSLPVKADLHRPPESEDSSAACREVVILPPGQTSPASPAPPLPNPFNDPAALERLKADVSHLKLIRDPSPSQLQYQGLLVPPPQGSSSFVNTNEEPLGNRYVYRNSRCRTSSARRAEEADDWLEGYTFMIEPAVSIGQNDAWARTRRVTIIASQASFSQQVEKQRAQGESASQHYDDPRIEGSRRRQIDHLLQERNNMDPRHHYQLASVKLNQRQISNGDIEIHSMQVILKRQFRQGFFIASPNNHTSRPVLISEVVDISDNDNARRHRNGSEFEHSGYRDIPSRSSRRDSRSHSAGVPHCRHGSEKSQASTTSRDSKDSGYASMSASSRQGSMSSSLYVGKDTRRAYHPSFSPPYRQGERTAPRHHEDHYFYPQVANSPRKTQDRERNREDTRPQPRKPNKKYYSSSSSSSESSEDESNPFLRTTTSTRSTLSSESRTYDDLPNATSHKPRSRSSEPYVAESLTHRQERSRSPWRTVRPDHDARSYDSPYSKKRTASAVMRALSPISAATAPPPFYVRALYDYDAEGKSSISFKQGDIIEVLSQPAGDWLDGILNGSRGWFPCNYCVIDSGNITRDGPQPFVTDPYRIPPEPSSGRSSHTPRGASHSPSSNATRFSPAPPSPGHDSSPPSAPSPDFPPPPQLPLLTLEDVGLKAPADDSEALVPYPGGRESPQSDRERELAFNQQR